MSVNNSSTNNLDAGQPTKASGQYHSTKGNVVEAIGDLTGATTWQESGKEEHAQGEAEYNMAQAKAYVEGGADILSGKKDAVLGAVTGDRSLETQGNVRQDKGKAEQALV